MSRRASIWSGWALGLLLCGCSTILGADFDRAPHPDDDSGSGSSSSGGTASGGTDANGGESGGGSSGGGPASGGAPVETGGQSSAGAQGMGGGPTLVVGDVFINEVAASGGTFVELYNASDNTAYLEGATLRNGSPGSPDSAKGAPFAEGTTIAPHGYLVVQSGSPNYGLVINASTTLFLVDAAENIVDSFAYPGSAKITLGSTYGRFPDGTQYRTQMSRTPGAANESS